MGTSDEHDDISVPLQRMPKRVPDPEAMRRQKLIQDEILHAARLDLVRRYLENPRPWPDGIESRANPWYTSNQAYWANLASGGSVNTAAVNTAVVEPVNTAVEPHVNTAAVNRDRAAYLRDYMRARRARAKEQRT